MLVAAFIAVLLAADLGRFAYAVGGHHGHAASATAAAGVLDNAATLSTLRGLFGELAAVSDAHTAPGTLLLRGTVTFEDPAHGYAIIAIAAAPGLYAVGSDVGGALLKEVYADHVVLDRGGVYETLTMAKPDGAFVLAGNAAAPAGVSDEPSPVERLPTVGELRARVEKVMAPLSSVISAKPLMNGELYSSLVVRPGADAITFQRLGLKPGDAIMAVNGKQVNPDTFAELTRDLLSGRPVRVYVNRIGEGPEEVKLNPAVLASLQNR